MVSEPFERQQESIKMYKSLAEKHGVKADSAEIKKMLKFAEYVKMDVESTLRILADEQALTPQQRRRIRYLYALEFGKVSVKVPPAELVPPEITPPEIKTGSAFTLLTGLEDKNTIYEAINVRDVLPNYVGLKKYDPKPIIRMGRWLEEWSVTFFRKKDKAMRLVKAKEVSMSTHYGDEVPDSRRLEFELLDIETGKPRYSFIYTKGKIISSVGNIPRSDIIHKAKDIGVWEL